MRTKLDKFLLIATVILLIAASYYIFYPAMKKIHYNRTHVLSEEQKADMFKKIQARGFFVGKEGKRPFMIVDENDKFHNGKEWCQL